MILFRSRLIFGIVRKILSSLFEAVYKIISLLNLQLTLLVVLVGIVLYLTGVFENRLYLIIFYFVVILSIIFSIYGTIRKLLGLGKKVDKKKNVQILESKKKKQQEAEEQIQTEREELEQVVEKRPTYPKYFRVRQRPNCIMAEYADRYELFEKRNSEWIKIRTDRK